MHLNITDSETGDNKGSSGQLVHYLDKENRMLKPEHPQEWFNGIGSGFQGYEIRNKLNRNIAKLCKKDAKFFLVNISPSQKEIRFLKDQFGDIGAEEKLKEFAVRVMDAYARNFKRAGIDSNTDLLWYGKLEHLRYYSYKDAEVKAGKARRGEAKPGEQMHIQVVVSRKDLSNKIKLSPENTSKGKNAEHSKKMGQFDRVAFKAAGERLFDELFGFTRPLTDTFRYANTQANGSLADRVAIHAELLAEGEKDGRGGLMKGKPLDLFPEPALQHFPDAAPTTFLDTVLAKADFDPGPAIRRRKKRRKGQMPTAELSF